MPTTGAAGTPGAGTAAAAVTTVAASTVAILPLTYTLMRIPSARYCRFVCARRNHNKVFVPTMEGFASANAMAMLHFAETDSGGLG